MSKQLTLNLAKDGETQTITFKLTPIGAAKIVRRLNKAVKEDWRLVSVQGGTEAVRAYIERQIKSYNADPDKYTIPVKDTIKTGWKAGGAIGKPNINLKTKLRLLKSKVRRPKK